MRPVPAWWPLYFEGTAYDERDRRAELAEALLAFFTADDAGFALLTAVRACLPRGGARGCAGDGAYSAWCADGL